MEPKEEKLKRVADAIDDMYGLQQWQKDILNKEEWDIAYDYLKGVVDDKIPITKRQADMLEKVLGDDFFIQDEKVRDILEALFECGFYYERDRKVLNLARDCYLKGRNWIKKNG